jgi:hypothetical protein
LHPQKPDAVFAGYVIWVAILNEQDIPEKYWPAVNTPVSMPNGIGDFLHEYKINVLAAKLAEAAAVNSKAEILNRF